MTRTVSTTLKAHKQGDTTTCAFCWKVTRVDGQVFGFTSCDKNLVISGVTYLASTSFSGTNISSSAGLAVDNSEVSAALSSDVITESDLYAGVWDFAEVVLFEVNYKDLSQGVRYLRRGRLGEVKLKAHSFTSELRGMTQAYSQQILDLTQPGCRVNLGDPLCTVDVTPYTFTGTVNVIVASRRVFTVTGLTQADGYFAGGKITFTSGLNTSLPREVKGWFNATLEVELMLPLPFDVLPGDTFSIIRGCDKTFTTCKNVFNNALNFQGEPFLRSQDSLYKPV